MNQFSPFKMPLGLEAQWLRVFVVLAKYQGLIPSTHMEARHLDTKHTCGTQVHMQSQHSYTQNKTNLKSIRE